MVFQTVFIVERMASEKSVRVSCRVCPLGTADCNQCARLESPSNTVVIAKSQNFEATANFSLLQEKISMLREKLTAHKVQHGQTFMELEKGLCSTEIEMVKHKSEFLQYKSEQEQTVKEMRWQLNDAHQKLSSESRWVGVYLIMFCHPIL